MKIEDLKRILVSNQKEVEAYKLVPRKLPSDEFPCRVLVGVRRAGKSFMLYQKMQELLSSGIGWSGLLYLNFEDDRLSTFSVDDFDLVLESHAQLYGEARPWLFLDEIQNIDGWEKFARRLADLKYNVWITGSNAKMLSSEIMTTLGGRYLSTEVYPYGFKEFLDARGVVYDEVTLLERESRSILFQNWNEYLHWGGLPEAINLTVKRDYLGSTFQKIYLGDIATRNAISNSNLLRLLIKKIAESVKQPISYNRLSNILSSVGGKVSMPTVGKYIEAAESAWLLFRVRNLSASLAERESICKYYFVDNGILNLFLIDGDTSLLENTVALELFRRYGHDTGNERVYFFRDRNEVDFYVPEEKLAIQVSYSIENLSETYEREVEALKNLPKLLPCERRLILTNNEDGEIQDKFGKIEIIPVWKWLLMI